MKVIPYGHQAISQDDINAVTETLRSDFLTQGPKIEEFEKKLAEYLGAKYAVVFNSGTAGLHAAYFTLGLKEGDEFITTPITFVATANAGLYLGAKPIFCDVEKDTGNIDVNKIEALITPKTKLLVPVHFAGNPVQLDKIKKIAQEHDLFVVEDACHALGATYKGQKIGNCAFSNMTVFSFHPVKHITTGEGGAVITNDESLYQRLQLFRSHGITKQNLQNTPDGDWYYEMQALGFNYRMSDIQAALGISQLNRIDQFITRRKEIVAEYQSAFSQNPYFDLPVETDGAKSAYHLFPIRLKDKYVKHRQQIFDTMRHRGLGIQVHYIPVYHQPYYREIGFSGINLPNTEDFYRREISIPIFQSLKEEDLQKVISTINSIFLEL